MRPLRRRGINRSTELTTRLRSHDSPVERRSVFRITYPGATAAILMGHAARLVGTSRVALPANIFPILAAACLVSGVTPRVAAAQHITVDGRFSSAQTLVGPNYSIGANLGKQVGSNLFHSFGQFSLANAPVPESATFTATGSTGPINNVIGRVTGGNQSSINGAIVSAISGANLYLINPSGIVFGPNATVNVSGSFHASTADYLKMSDGAKFQATNPGGSTLSAAPPAAFGFLNANPAKISVNGSTLGPVPGTLGLVGGPVSITGPLPSGATCTLCAPAGTIHVTSAAGTGEVPVDPRNRPALTVTSFGPVSISGGSTLDVSNSSGLGSGGSVFIRSGALAIDSSEINADNYGSGPGGKLLLRGDNQLALSNGANVHSIAQANGGGAAVILRSATGGILSADTSGVAVGSDAAGNSGKLVLRGGQVSLTNGTQVVSIAQSTGNGGAIAIKANNLVIDSGASVTSTTLGAGLTDPSGNPVAAGPGATITVTAQNLTIQNGANVVAQSLGDGRGGAIAITTGSLLADGGAALNLFTGIFSDTAGAGNGGSITIVAGNLALHNGANVLACASGVPLCTGASPQGSAAGGDLSVSVGGSLTIDSGASLGTVAYAGGNAGNLSVAVAGPLTIDMSVGLMPSILDGIGSLAVGGGDAGSVSVTAQMLAITNNGVISSDTTATGNSGDVFVDVSGALSVSSPNGTPNSATGILADAEPGSSGNAGKIFVTAGTLSLASSGVIASTSFGSGGSISISVTGGISIDSANAQLTGITSSTVAGSERNAGNVVISAGSLSVVGANGVISSDTLGTGSGGNVSILVTGDLSIRNGSRISAGTVDPKGGNAGRIAVAAGDISIVNGAFISTSTHGSGAAGEISVNASGELVIDGAGSPSGTAIGSNAFASGNAGRVTVTAGRISISSGGEIQTATLGSGDGGDINVSALGNILINGSGGGIVATAEPGSVGRAGAISLVGQQISISDGGLISSSTAGPGKGGTVQVTAQGPLILTDPGTGIVASATPTASGNAGSVTVTAPQITLMSGAEIASTTAGTGAGGSVTVTTPGALVLDGAGVANTQIAASATGPQSGPGGPVTVNANSLTVEGGAQIASKTAGPGAGGDIAVTVANGVTLSGVDTAGAASGITASAGPGSTGQAGQVVLTAGGAVALSGGAKAASSTAGSGNGGTVQVAARGILTLTDPGTGITASAEPGSSGNAGSVVATAPQITIASGAEIASTTAGTGMGGSITVTTPGMLVLDGAGLAGNTEIAASATGTQSGPGGSVTIMADALAIEGGARIASTTFGPGKAGDIAVTVANGVTLSGTGPTGASGITAAAQSGSSGQAGEVTLIAGGAIALSGGAKVTSSTAGAGNGGTVEVSAKGPLSLSDPGSGIIASAFSTASGNAGSVSVSAPQIALLSGAEIASTTAGTGAGGSVSVATPGTLVLNGNGDPATQIATSAIGPQSGPGGSVTVAANSLTVEGGAKIASSTAGSGKGGDVNIAVASDIVLPDPGPQITARSTGSGDAGSITVSATRLLMNDGAAISTEAAASTANGGNITLHVRDLLYLTSSEISTSVKGETGNGGNIAIDPQLVILDHSSIIAQAIEGHGGNITITAGQFIPSSDSIVSASSELGISGTIVINGPRVDVNGALVVLSTQLRSRTEVLREACVARAGQPISSLVEAGRGGLPQDPEATLPALYIAGRDLDSNPHPGTDTVELSGTAIHATARLTMRCG